MSKSLLTIGVLVLLLFVCLFAGCIILGRDVPPPDVSDLVVERMDVPDEDNAYTWLVAATNALVDPDYTIPISALIDGSTNAPELVAELVTTNAAMYAFLEKAVGCPVCHPPEITSFDTMLPYLPKWRSMGRLLALKAAEERRAGRLAESAQTTASLLRFADLVQEDAELIIQHLVGIAILGIGVTQAGYLAETEGITAEDLEPLLGALSEIGPFHPGLIRAIKVEYRVISNTLGDLSTADADLDTLAGLPGMPRFLPRGKRIPGYFFQPNRTRLLFAEVYREMIENAPRDYAHMNMPPIVEERVTRFWMLKPNGVGYILQRMILPALDAMLERKCRAQCMVTATRLVLACKAYEIRNETLPETLEDLVPRYLNTVPTDPYDGEPFRYLPTRRLVYSVGEDTEDSNASSDLRAGEMDSGGPRQNQWRTKDPIFPIP